MNQGLVNCECCNDNISNCICFLFQTNCYSKNNGYVSLLFWPAEFLKTELWQWEFLKTVLLVWDFLKTVLDEDRTGTTRSTWDLPLILAHHDLIRTCIIVSLNSFTHININKNG